MNNFISSFSKVVFNSDFLFTLFINLYYYSIFLYFCKVKNSTPIYVIN
uniref:Uncharacterized protein n=1 Tax=Siphoviridae sp. ctRiO19 TaxID=2826337 RepID=A0A8S5LWM8_9CAUD|nr:MAG TPA: hypothetical protein [Siphoviridae sp. ctRiO19]